MHSIYATETWIERGPQSRNGVCLIRRTLLCYSRKACACGVLPTGMGRRTGRIWPHTDLARGFTTERWSHDPILVAAADLDDLRFAES